MSRNIYFTATEGKALRIMAKNDDTNCSEFIRKILRQEAEKHGLLSPEVWVFVRR